MNILITTIVMILSLISSIICTSWTIISYVNYLVKDTEFEWSSIWFSVISVIILITSSVIFGIIRDNYKRKLEKEKIDRFYERVLHRRNV